MGVIFKNNVMYNGGDTLIQPIIYSEKEREIGCWTDGKPLYQRTLFYTGNTVITVSGDSGSPYSATGITDIYVNDILPTLDKLIHYQIDLTSEGNEKNIYQFEYNFQALTGTFMRSHNPGIAFIGYNIIPGSSITLQYTKTTDQPGSGIWTPQGTYAEHYSTDEQVVGTWIDGSTIYEKTLYYSSISTSKTDWIQLIQFDEADMLLSYNTRATWNNRQLDNAYLRISLYNGHLYHHEAELTNGSTLSNYYATIRYTKTTS